MHASTNVQRAIAVAPLPSDLSAMVGAPHGMFPFGVNVPQYFPPQLGFNTGVPSAPTSTGKSNGASNGRNCVGASRHMAAEQRRRARINERLEALRGLVPHSARANTAAFLAEVYDYIGALHRQLAKVGCTTFDLNVAATEEMKENKTPAEGAENISHIQKMAEHKSDGESDVESGSHAHLHNTACNESGLFVSTVSAPSLFVPLTEKVEKQSVSSSNNPQERVNSPKGDVKSATPAVSESSPDVSLTVGRKSPFEKSCQEVVSVPCYSPATLSHGNQASRNMENINMSSCALQSIPFPSMHHGTVVDAAAAAQSWGMAAAMAHAQAQVAVQMHAQAQAMIHAQAQAQAQAHAQVQAYNGRTYGTVQKKRRRGSPAGAPANKNLNLQGVLRPIALKPSHQQP